MKITIQNYILLFENMLYFAQFFWRNNIYYQKFLSKVCKNFHSVKEHLQFYSTTSIRTFAMPLL